MDHRHYPACFFRRRARVLARGYIQAEIRGTKFPHVTKNIVPIPRYTANVLVLSAEN